MSGIENLENRLQRLRESGLDPKDEELARLTHQAASLIMERRTDEITEEQKDALGKVMETFREDNRWISEHTAELRKKYPNQYVVVFRERVVATCGPDPAKLNELRELTESLGIFLEWTAIKFIPTEEKLWMLSHKT